MSQRKAARRIVIQARDIPFLRGLFEARVMTIGHASSLYFDGRIHAAKKRVGKLKAAGFIGERPRRQFEPSILILRHAGLLELSRNGSLDGYPRMSRAAFERRIRVSPLTLRHELDVMDIKAAICAAVAKSGTASVREFSTWPGMNQFEADGFVVKPDGFFVIEEKRPDGSVATHRFFLELDRSTESQGVLVSRAARYRAYHRSGGFARRHGVSGAAAKECHFRVLYVLQSAKRRDNIAARLLQLNPPILTHVWLATAPDLRENPLGQIWIRPLDWRDARVAAPQHHRLF